MVAPVSTAPIELRALPPADRPKGRRGWRGWIAATLAIAAPAIMLAARLQTTSGGGGGAVDGRASYDYTLSGPPGLGLKAALVGLAFAGAALFLWTARHPRGLATAAALTAVALAGTVAVASQFEPAEIAERQLRALEPGLPRSTVEDRLGAPAGTGTYSGPRRDLDCLVWDLERPLGDYDRGYALVCFAGDRFELRRAL